MKRLKTLIVGMALFVSTVFVVPALLPVEVGAVNPIDEACQSGSDSTICDHTDENVNTIIGIVVNTLLFVVGILSVVMIIVGGLRYTASAGDSNAVTGAKNTILFAVIGLVVSFAAYAIVNWVLDIF